MRQLLALLLAPSLLIAMEAPLAPLSPCSTELAQQAATINANRIEQQAFQDEATNWVAGLESDVTTLQKEVKRLGTELPIVLTSQLDAASLALQAQKILAGVHNEQIGALREAQQLQALTLLQKIEALQNAQRDQAQRQEQHEAELQQRISVAENSNYYLKWALGITTAVTTTAFSLMGYLLWKNQQHLYEANKITVQEDYKGKVLGFSQARNDAPYVYIPQPISNPSQPAAVAARATTPAVTFSKLPLEQAPAPTITPVPTLDPSKYVTQEHLNTVPKVTRIIGQDGKSIYHKFDCGDGKPSYSPAFWPNPHRP